jgi:hypothetical protein
MQTYPESTTNALNLSTPCGSPDKQMTMPSAAEFETRKPARRHSGTPRDFGCSKREFAMRDTRRFVESRLKDLSALCDGEPRIAREEITVQ